MKWCSYAGALYPTFPLVREDTEKHKTNKPKDKMIENIKRMATEDGGGADPFAANVGDKDLTKFPLLQPDRLMRFEIRKPTVGPTKKDANKSILTFPCYTTTDSVDLDGNPLHKGFPVFHRIPITPSEERTAKQISRDVAILCQAAGVKDKTVRDIMTTPTLLDGKLFDAKTVVIPEKDGFSPSNALRPVPLA